MRLSPHWSLWELTVTDYPLLQVEPSREDIVHAVGFLHSSVEPLRRACGVPFRTESFKRGEALNQHVDGSDTSLHLKALALDFTPRGLHRRLVWERLLELRSRGLPFTEAIIYEDTGHIHIAYDWVDANNTGALLVKLSGGTYQHWHHYTGKLKGGL